MNWLKGIRSRSREYRKKCERAAPRITKKVLEKMSVRQLEKLRAEINNELIKRAVTLK